MRATAQHGQSIAQVAIVITGVALGCAALGALGCGGKVVDRADGSAGDESSVPPSCGIGKCTAGDSCREGACFACTCNASGWTCTSGVCADADSPCPATAPADRVVPCSGTGFCEYFTPCHSLSVCGGGVYHNSGCASGR